MRETVIQPGAIVEGDVSLGQGCFIGYYAVIRGPTTIGDNSEVRQLCHIAPNVTIGSGVKIFSLTNVASGTVIEDRVYIGSSVLFTNTNRLSHGRHYKPLLKGAHVEYGARVASGACILPGVRIGRESLIGLGSVVTKDCEPFWVYFGNPAEKVRSVPEDERLDYDAINNSR